MLKLYTVEISSSSLENWDESLKKSVYANYFQSTNYLESLPNSNPIYISILDAKKNIVGQVGITIIKTAVQYSSSFLMTSMKIISNISNISNRGIWLFGPIIHTCKKNERILILKEILKGLETVCEKYDLVFVKGFTSPYDFLVDDDYLNEFKINNFIISKSVTYLEDLSLPVENIWKKISKKTRGDVSRAKRRGIIVKQIKNYYELEEYVKLHQTWVKTKGLSLSASAYDFQKTLKNIHSNNEIFFLAYQDNKVISGLRLVQFNGIIYTYQVLSSYSQDTSLGGTLLTWKAIEWAKQKNYKFYDFSGGSGQNLTKNEENLLFYKKKWGGNEITHHNMLKIRKKSSFRIFNFLEKTLVWYHSLKTK